MPPDAPAADSSLLADGLAALVGDLDLVDGDLAGRLADLRRDLGLAVPSTLGLTVTLWSDCTWPIRITVVDDDFRPGDVAATLRLPMDRLSSRFAAASITYYAASPDAFADLADRLVHALDLPPGVAVLDEGPHRSVTGSGVSGLSAARVVNRAIGVLIARGMSPAAARATYGGDGGLTADALADAVDLVAASSNRWPHDL